MTQDLPFYSAQQGPINARGWLLVLGTILLAVAMLMLIPSRPIPFAFLAAVLFTGLPLGGLAFAAGPQWTAIFRPFGPLQCAQAVAFGLLTLIASAGAGLLLLQLMPLDPNPAIAALGRGTLIDLIVFVAHAAIQLVGEELVTILPLLAVLWFCVTKMGLSRGVGLAIALLVSTIWFAAIHLPTYNWNVMQCLGAIGVARVMLTVSYLVTRNLWVSAGAHILNDCTLFFLSFAGGHLQAAAISS